MRAVRIYGMVLQFTSQGLRDDEEVVRLAIREDSKALQLKATTKLITILQWSPSSNPSKHESWNEQT